jgi:hypothetical protein
LLHAKEPNVNEFEDAVLSLDALSTVCGGMSYGELACRSVGAVGGTLAGVGIGSLGAGGVASTAVNATKLARRTGMVTNMVSGAGGALAGNRDPKGAAGMVLSGADTAASIGSFVPGPVGAVSTAWMLGRTGSDLGAWACGY